MIQKTSKLLALVALLAFAGTSCKNTPKGMTPEEYNKKLAELKQARYQELDTKLNAMWEQVSPGMVKSMTDSLVAAQCPVPVKGAKVVKKK
jgi:hypothetical protein